MNNLFSHPRLLHWICLLPKTNLACRWIGSNLGFFLRCRLCRPSKLSLFLTAWRQIWPGNCWRLLWSLFLISQAVKTKNAEKRLLIKLRFTKQLCWFKDKMKLKTWEIKQESKLPVELLVVSTLLVMDASWFALVTLGLPDLGRSLRSSPTKCLVFHLCIVLLCTWSSSATSLTPMHSGFQHTNHTPHFLFCSTKIFSSTESYWTPVSC